MPGASFVRTFKQIKVMIQLHETIMGRRLIEGTLPDIAEQLKRIADSLEKLLEKQNVDPNKDEVEKIIKKF